MSEPAPDQPIRNLGMELYRQTARADAAENAEDARDIILQIVADWIAHADTGDLAWELYRAGYTLPEPTTEQDTR